MASISKGPDGHRTIQFIDRDRKRKSIRLGKVSQRLADSIKGKVEALNAAQISRCPVDDDAARWVSQIGDDLAAKLAGVGLVAERASTLLGDFLDSYIARRTDVKPNTRRNLEACKTRLVDFFGAAKPMREISPGDADAWLLWLRERYANGTAGRTAKRAKQFFRAAVRARLIPSDSFLDVKPPTQANEARQVLRRQRRGPASDRSLPRRRMAAYLRALPLRWASLPFRVDAVDVGERRLGKESLSRSRAEDRTP